MTVCVAGVATSEKSAVVLTISMTVVVWLRPPPDVPVIVSELVPVGVVLLVTTIITLEPR
jgi:hypothetical protein